MKVIKRDKLLNIIKQFKNDDSIFIDEIQEIYDDLGDDWFIVDGHWELCAENNKKYDPKFE